MSAPKRLIVALGNPYFGEDAFGSAVMRELERGRRIGADLLEAGTDLLASLDRFCEYDEVILIDTVIDPSRAGQVRTIEQEELLEWPEASPTCHSLSPLLAIKLFKTLKPASTTRFALIALFSDGVSAAHSA